MKHMMKKVIITLLILAFVLVLSFYRMGFYKLDFGEKEIPEKRGENTIEFQEAPDNVGESYWVRGEVDHVFVSEKENHFINFCEDYRECPFSATIFREDTENFIELEIQEWEGEIIHIYGDISLYEGRPQVIIETPEQVILD